MIKAIVVLIGFSASLALVEAPALADGSAELTDQQSAEVQPLPEMGPPMTEAEQDAFLRAVVVCWNVGEATEAATVTVGFDLDRNGKVVGEVRQIGGSGGSDAAISTAFGAARRAILRCQQDGFQLPADKYEQWREVEMTFDPNGMRLR